MHRLICVMKPEIVHDLVRSIEAKDLSTAAHTWRVVLYTRALAEAMGLGQDEIHALTHAAALHDVGKIDIPSKILQKPGRLTDEEFEVIKLHPVAGHARMVDMGVDDEAVLDLIRHHHERWDGRGYPMGLKGEEIPVAARFFSVIDAFDAMTSVRPYRPVIGEDAAEMAIAELEANKGTMYWPEAVDAFVDLYRTGKLDYVIEHFNDSKQVQPFSVELKPGAGRPVIDGTMRD